MSDYEEMFGTILAKVKKGDFNEAFNQLTKLPEEKDEYLRILYHIQEYAIKQDNKDVYLKAVEILFDIKSSDKYYLSREIPYYWINDLLSLVAKYNFTIEDIHLTSQIFESLFYDLIDYSYSTECASNHYELFDTVDKQEIIQLLLCQKKFDQVIEYCKLVLESNSERYDLKDYFLGVLYGAYIYKGEFDIAKKNLVEYKEYLSSVKPLPLYSDFENSKVKCHPDPNNDFYINSIFTYFQDYYGLAEFFVMRGHKEDAGSLIDEIIDNRYGEFYHPLSARMTTPLFRILDLTKKYDISLTKDKNSYFDSIQNKLKEEKNEIDLKKENQKKWISDNTEIESFIKYVLSDYIYSNIRELVEIGDMNSLFQYCCIDSDRYFGRYYGNIVTIAYYVIARETSKGIKYINELVKERGELWSIYKYKVLECLSYFYFLQKNYKEAALNLHKSYWTSIGLFNPMGDCKPVGDWKLYQVAKLYRLADDSERQLHVLKDLENLLVNKGRSEDIAKIYFYEDYYDNFVEICIENHLDDLLMELPQEHGQLERIEESLKKYQNEKVVTDNAEIKKCRNCETENIIDAIFCKKCGAQFDLTCPNCGSKLEQEDIFCIQCGTKIKDAK